MVNSLFIEKTDSFSLFLVAYFLKGAFIYLNKDKKISIMIKYDWIIKLHPSTFFHPDFLSLMSAAKKSCIECQSGSNFY